MSDLIGGPTTLVQDLERETVTLQREVERLEERLRQCQARIPVARARRSQKRYADALRTVLALAEGHGVLGMPDANEKKALDHLRATLKTEAIP